MKPAETTILDIIEARLLANITIANGYEFAFKKISRGKIGGCASSEYPAVNFWSVRHGVDQDSYGNDVHLLHVIMDARVMTRDENFPDVSARLIAYTYTGLIRSLSAPALADVIDYNLAEPDWEGDLIPVVDEVNLYDAGYQIGAGELPWCGAAIEIQIKYSSPLGDLFTINEPT